MPTPIREACRGVAMGVLCLFAACTLDTGAPEVPTARGGVDIEGTQAALFPDTETKNTFTTDWLEIDAVGPGSGDANLFAGADPATDPDLPVGGLTPYLDWDELVRTGGVVDPDLLDAHRQLDDFGAKDASAFPQANSCVGDASVLDKMNLTYGAVANNNAYVYLGAQRAKNNGDAAYYWIFTREQPEFVPSSAPSCASGYDLAFHLQTAGSGASGDVLIRGLFRPSADEPALEVFQAAQTVDVLAEYVIDIELLMNGNLVWTPWGDPTPGEPTDDIVVAVNTNPTEAGALGYEGVVSRSGTVLGEHIFAEGAVPLQVFTGGAPCGESYWTTLLSRPSHSPTSDPKDYIGPFPVNFGSTEASGELTPSCGYNTVFSASGLGADGETIPSEFLVCSWDFGGGFTSGDCAGDLDLLAGTYDATVTVTDIRNDCSDDFDLPQLEVYDPLGISGDSGNLCDDVSGFDVCASPSGGSGSYSLAWEFTGPGDVTPPDPTPACPTFGKALVTVAGAYSGTVTVTDTGRVDDLTCTEDADVTPTAFVPLDADLVAATAVCSDAATFTVSHLTGGLGPYSYDWSDDACDGGSVCAINPADDQFCGPGSLDVTVSDSSGVCDTVFLEGTYQKETLVTACGTTGCSDNTD